MGWYKKSVWCSFLCLCSRDFRAVRWGGCKGFGGWLLTACSVVAVCYVVRGVGGSLKSYWYSSVIMIQAQAYTPKMKQSIYWVLILQFLVKGRTYIILLAAFFMPGTTTTSWYLLRKVILNSTGSNKGQEGYRKMPSVFMFICLKQTSFIGRNNVNLLILFFVVAVFSS